MDWLLFVLTILGPGHVAVDAQRYEERQACFDKAGEIMRRDPAKIATCERKKEA